MPLRTVDILSKIKKGILLNNIANPIFRFQVELIFRQLGNTEVTIKEIKREELDRWSTLYR